MCHRHHGVVRMEVATFQLGAGGPLGGAPARTFATKGILEGVVVRALRIRNPFTLQ